jgi:hypothetical protein
MEERKENRLMKKKTNPQKEAVKGDYDGRYRYERQP